MCHATRLAAIASHLSARRAHPTDVGVGATSCSFVPAMAMAFVCVGNAHAQWSDGHWVDAYEDHLDALAEAQLDAEIAYMQAKAAANGAGGAPSGWGLVGCLIATCVIVWVVARLTKANVDCCATDEGDSAPLPPTAPVPAVRQGGDQ